MPSPWSRAANDPLRPARLFAPVFALGAGAFLALAVYAGVTAADAQPRVVATGAAGRLVLPEAASGNLVIYGATSSGQEPSEDVRCELSPSGPPRAGFDSSNATLEVQGEILHRTGDLERGWVAGDILTCADSDTLAVTTGGGAIARTGMAVLGAFGFLLASVLAVTGFRSRRSAHSRLSAAP